VVASIFVRKFLKTGAVPLLAWFLLVDPAWRNGGPPLPISHWQSAGSFDSRQRCESARIELVGEPDKFKKDMPKKLPLCVPDTEEGSQVPDRTK